MRTVPANCRHCNEPFVRVIAGKGGTQRFCSVKCRELSTYQRYNPRPAKPCRKCGSTIAAGAHANRDYCSKECKKAVDSVVAKAKYPGTYTPRRYQKTCVTCGKSYVAKKRHGKACSQKCLNKWHLTVPEHRDRMRKCGDVRRAREKGAPVVERFSPNEVFTRDGWICQLCGSETPQSLRGTRHCNAPEVDHIVPLSKGGEHTLRNVQCACHSCNSRKRNRVGWTPTGVAA